MTVAFIIGLCAIATIWGLVRGGGGRLMLVAAVVTGWGVGLARQLSDTGTGIAANLGDMLAQLGGSL
jgi:hypothetical protein